MAGDQKEVFLKPLEVFERVGQAVGVVHPKAGDASLTDPAKEQTVDKVEDLRVFHPDAGQVGHVEEAPVIDFLGGDPPVGEAIDLIFQ